MKNIVKLFPLTLLAALLVGCDNGAIAATEFNAPDYRDKFQLNTQAQIDYLSKTYYGENSITQDENIKGLEENSQPNPVKINWENTGCEKGYKVYISETEDLANPWIYEANSAELSVFNLKVDTKYYYQVEENIENSRVSNIASFTTDKGIRNLYLDGVTNVRDLGGYWVGENNKTIKQGLLFRGGRLNNSYPYGSGSFGHDYSKKDTTAIRYEREITEAGIKEFQRLGIKNEIDLRQPEGNGFPGPAEDEVTFSNVEGTYYNMFSMGTSDPLVNATNKKAVKNAFELMSNIKNYPIYFHCNIGTNRTGTIAMLVEALCGVSEADLMKDYLFSNFGTICIAERQYDNKAEVRAAPSDVTATNEVFDRLIKASGSSMSEKAISVLMQAGLEKDTILKVKNILIG